MINHYDSLWLHHGPTTRTTSERLMDGHLVAFRHVGQEEWSTWQQDLRRMGKSLGRSVKTFGDGHHKKR